MSLILVNTSCICSSNINITSSFLSLSVIDSSSEASSVIPSFVWVVVLLVLVPKLQVLFPVFVWVAVRNSLTRMHYQDGWCFQHPDAWRGCHATTVTTRKCQPTKCHGTAPSCSRSSPCSSSTSIKRTSSKLAIEVWRRSYKTSRFCQSSSTCLPSPTTQIRNRRNTSWTHWITAHRNFVILVFVTITEGFSTSGRPWSILGRIQQNVWRERSSPYNNNKTSNITTTIMPNFSIRCRISTTCMWPRLERHSSHHHVSMGTPWWYQNLVAKPAQTNYFVGSHYSSNRLRQPAIWATTRTTTVLWIISSGFHSSNPPNIFKHFDPRAHANWHFES